MLACLQCLYLEDACLNVINRCLYVVCARVCEEGSGCMLSLVCTFCRPLYMWNARKGAYVCEVMYIPVCARHIFMIPTCMLLIVGISGVSLCVRVV